MLSLQAPLLKALPVNGLIAIIAPAGPREFDAEAAVNWFAQRGFGCRLYPSATTHGGYLAGADACRLADLHAAFADPQVDAIICLRGGYGSMRLLDGIDFKLLRDNPKPFIGYSDITALHTAIARYAGFVTFHGAMLTSELLASRQPPTESSLFDLLQGRVRAGECLEHPEHWSLTTLLPGRAQGRLVGGNLAMIGATLGTRFDIELAGNLLFIEDIGEPLYRVDRLLTQLRLAGKFEGLQGVLVGDFTKLGVEEMAPLLRETFAPLGIPVLAAWRSGHCDPNLTLPLGAMMSLDADRQELRLEQELFRL
ncbi:LD-carboxypeptidase [Pseudomonas sp. R5(2019)]|uniref:S66 peptidase family protein n=1 Tax=Pseudomonas sp. R5(2019) TaxID=2697566 RepID=UPI0015B4F2CF